MCGLSDAQHLTAHVQCFPELPPGCGEGVPSGSIAAAPEVEPGAAIASPVADASAVGVAGVLGAGAAEALGALDGGLGLGADGLLEVGGAQRSGAAGELVHWCVPFWRSPRVVTVGGCGRAGECLRAPSPDRGSL